MQIRGIRGATVAPANTQEAIVESTRELLENLIAANGVQPADVASIYFTVTPDLDAAFPASAARAIGWNETALLDAVAPPVPGDLPRCIRVLVHWNTGRSSREIRHVYLREAMQLRPDRAQGV